ncbi:MAG: VOC family protein, partial [Bacteroidota bacterium]
MRIKELKLYTKHLKAQREFYSKTLGFQVLESGPSHFSVQIGWSLFTFAESQKTHDYHFCFLIPCNSLDSALEWMEKRITLILSPDGQKTHRFESWDADSFYFYDAGGNVVEFIVRHQLHNTIDVYFEVT